MMWSCLLLMALTADQKRLPVPKFAPVEIQKPLPIPIFFEDFAPIETEPADRTCTGPACWPSQPDRFDVRRIWRRNYVRTRTTPIRRYLPRSSAVH